MTRVVVLVLALACASRVAHADDKPWAAGVDASSQKIALDLYNAANQLFEDGAYPKALELYNEALAKWDHPKIHYNAAICLKKMDRLVEAYEHLLAALKYGAAPFTHEVYQQALALQTELEKSVASLEIKSKQDGAQISLDGHVILTKPGAAQMHVLANTPHQLVAAKPTYETQTRSITLEPGQETTLVIELHLMAQPKQLARRWSAWLPWAVVGGGAAIAGGGGLFAWRASKQYSEYDRGVAQAWEQAQMTGMAPVTPKFALDAHSRGDRDRTLSYTGLAVGGVAVAAGITMVLMNQGHLVAVPAVGKESAGVSILGSF
ncbi:MAG: PEGA domain-containing protein [Deltaproteobacteria bacterium]|nr:PEGA domain-containing protein [Deltaproteobacteria bacterium]